MSLPGLTEREQRIFGAIRTEIVAGRPPPSYAELAALASSKGGAIAVVTSLVTKGYLTRRPGRNRALALTPSADAYTVHLDPHLNRRLAEYVAAWGATPEHDIVQAITNYLGFTNRSGRQA